jgi:hypothetical protein
VLVLRSLMRSLLAVELLAYFVEMLVGGLLEASAAVGQIQVGSRQTWRQEVDLNKYHTR